MPLKTFKMIFSIIKFYNKKFVIIKIHKISYTIVLAINNIDRISK